MRMELTSSILWLGIIKDSIMAINVSHEKLVEIRDRILDRADTLLLQLLSGQKEPFLEHLGLGYRRFRIIFVHLCKTKLKKEQQLC